MHNDGKTGSDRHDTRCQTSEVRERQVEWKLVQEVRKKYGMCLKFVSPGTAGVPDRIVLMPGGRMAFVEVKRPGEKMRPLQLRRKRQIEQQGFKVFCLDDPEKIGEVLDEIQGA